MLCLVILSVQPRAKNYAWIYVKFLPKVDRGFILEVIRIDLHCHLEVTVVQPDSFGINFYCSAEVVRDTAKVS